MIPDYIHGVHDVDGVHLMDGYPGWVVITEAIGHDPNDRSGRDYSQWSGRGLGVIVRLNNAHDGINGTIPAPEDYAAFATRCANFVQASTGIALAIIGNEPNHSDEWPRGRKIEPEDYVRCYNLCFAAIGQVRPDLPILVAAVGPWNQKAGDWLDYLRRVVRAVVKCGGFALHAYTHGADPALIFSDEMKHGWYWHFRVYRQQMVAIREIVQSRAAAMWFIITETDQGDHAWVDADTGWVQNAYKEIADWNNLQPQMAIRGLCLYRSNRHDKWSFADKAGVQHDFRKAVERGYKMPLFSSPATPQRDIPPPQPSAPSASASAAPSLPPRDIDPRLIERGMKIESPTVQPGENHWRLVKARWFNKEEAGGRHNVFVEAEDTDGKLLTEKSFLVSWPDGEHGYRTKKGRGFEAGDAPLSPGHAAFSVEMLSLQPSEVVHGIGMGEDTPNGFNPGIHTATLLTFRDVTMSVTSQPTPPAPSGKVAYVAVTSGANLRTAPDLETGEVLVIVPYGDEVEIAGHDTGSDDRLWARARYEVFGGWIRADLLSDTQPAPNPTPPQPTTSQVPTLLHPIADPAKRVVSQIFGVNAARYAKWHLAGHNGVDFAVEVGTPVRAVADGVVAEAAIDPDGYGVYVKLEHGPFASLCAHLHQWAVVVGQRVTAGQVIGLSGNTGNSSGPHLHFGLRPYPAKWDNGFNGYVDPLPYLNAAAAPSESTKPAPSRAELLIVVESAAIEFKVDWRLLASLIQAESSFNPASINPSSGARGLGNIMPGTWGEWSVNVGASNINDPADNARVTAAYLAWCIKTAGNERKGLWAYNWGIRRVLEGKTPPAETVAYASKVLFGRDLLVIVGA